MNNPDQRIQEIVKSITCYDYLKMDDKSYKFLEEKAVKAIKSELQRVQDEARKEERKRAKYLIEVERIATVHQIWHAGEMRNEIYNPRKTMAYLEKLHAELVKKGEGK
jgi:hypothetical protein